MLIAAVFSAVVFIGIVCFFGFFLTDIGPAEIRKGLKNFNDNVFR